MLNHFTIVETHDLIKYKHKTIKVSNDRSVRVEHRCLNIGPCNLSLKGSSLCVSLLLHTKFYRSSCTMCIPLHIPGKNCHLREAHTALQECASQPIPAASSSPAPVHLPRCSENTPQHPRICDKARISGRKVKGHNSPSKVLTQVHPGHTA